MARPPAPVGPPTLDARLPTPRPMAQAPAPVLPRKTNTTKRLLLGLSAALLLLILALALFGPRGPEGTEVEVATAEVRTLTEVVTASGKVRPELEVKISSDVSGEIVHLTVKEGERVEQGQLLVRIQPDFYAAQREQAEAGLLQAQADASRARSEMLRAQTELERQQQLFERGVVPEADLQAAQSAFEVAEASHEAALFRVRSAQASLSQAAEQLGRTSIYAPIGGIVSQLNVELGERVVGTAQMSGTEIMRIADLRQMELEVDVNENDVVRLALGDSARVEIDAYPGRPFRGVVTQIANSARVQSAGTQEEVTNFPVKVQITSSHNTGSGAAAPAAGLAEAPAAPAPVLRPGMSGTVDVFTETVEGAVVVPIQAVTVRDLNELRRRRAGEAGRPEEEDLRRVVFVMEADTARLVEVQTGIADQTHIEIAGGLEGGEAVVTGPFRTLRTELAPGERLRVRRAPNARS